MRPYKKALKMTILSRSIENRIKIRKDLVLGAATRKIRVAVRKTRRTRKRKRIGKTERKKRASRSSNSRKTKRLMR